MLAFIGEHFRTSTVTIFASSISSCVTTWPCSVNTRPTTAKPWPASEDDLAAGDIDVLPVNCCVTRQGGRRHAARLLQAKSHPFFGEETIDPYSDLYRGKVFPLFRCVPTVSTSCR